MENQSELILALNELKEENIRQRRLLEKQCRLTRLLSVLFLCLVAVVVVFLFTLLPRITETLDELNVVMENTQEITSEIKTADINGTIQSLNDTLESVSGLVDDSAESLSQTLQKMEAMDIDTLNKAILDLYQVVDPLASLFSR